MHIRFLIFDLDELASRRIHACYALVHNVIRTIMF